MEDLSKINNTISRIPTSPQQVAQKLVSSALKTDNKKDTPEDTTEPAPQA